MNYQCEEAKLSAKEIAEICRNMEAKGLSHVFCQTCSEEMKPEQARKRSTVLIMCRPCYTCAMTLTPRRMRLTKTLRRTFKDTSPAPISHDPLTLYSGRNNQRFFSAPVFRMKSQFLVVGI